MRVEAQEGEIQGGDNELTGFDFTDTWTIVEYPDDYPILQW